MKTTIRSLPVFSVQWLQVLMYLYSFFYWRHSLLLWPVFSSLLLKWNIPTLLIVSGLVIIGYTAFAGMAGVINTDTIQFIIIIFMIVFLFIPGIWSDTEGIAKANGIAGQHAQWNSKGD
jgi:Na+/proline symporter